MKASADGWRRAWRPVAGVALLGGACAGAAAESQRLAFENAWVRAPRGGQTIAAAYCDIANRSATRIVVTGFRPAGTGGPARVEIHETTEEMGEHGSVVRMRPLAGLAIAPGQTLSLRPGGKHLMLFGMDADTEAVEMRAVFQDGAVQRVRFVVRAGAMPLRRD